MRPIEAALYKGFSKSLGMQFQYSKILCELSHHDSRFMAHSCPKLQNFHATFMYRLSGRWRTLLNYHSGDIVSAPGQKPDSEKKITFTRFCKA